MDKQLDEFLQYNENEKPISPDDTVAQSLPKPTENTNRRIKMVDFLIRAVTFALCLVFILTSALVAWNIFVEAARVLGFL